MESIHDFWHATTAFAGHISDVGLGALLLALCFQVANLLLRASAWRNILRAALPESRIRWRTVTGSYLAGAGVNAVVPARGGDVMKLFLVHRSVPEAHYPTIASTLFAETLFDIVVGSTLLAWAFSRGLIPGTPQLSGKLGAFEWSFFARPREAAGGAAGRVPARHRLRDDVDRGARQPLLGTCQGRPRHPDNAQRYLKGVVSLQALGWGCRLMAMYWFLQAFNVPADLTDAATALSAGSIATLLPLTPGGAGTQQALLAYMFRGVASQSTVLSFSVGMQFAITLTTATLGGICLAVMLKRAPWKATRVPDQVPPAAAPH